MCHIGFKLLVVLFKPSRLIFLSACFITRTDVFLHPTIVVDFSISHFIFKFVFYMLLKLCDLTACIFRISRSSFWFICTISISLVLMFLFYFKFMIIFVIAILIFLSANSIICHFCTCFYWFIFSLVMSWISKLFCWSSTFDCDYYTNISLGILFSSVFGTGVGQQRVPLVHPAFGSAVLKPLL